MVYDTDMGSDDWLAALLLLCHPAVDLKAITVTGAGLAHAEYGVRHALSLVALAGKRTVEVARGRETPLKGSNAFPSSWREESDNLAGLELPPGTPASTRSAVETILSLSHEPGGKLTVVATGPLTNLAEALRADPTLRDRLAMIYVMGGAVEVAGNVHATCPELPNGTAEWNFYVDPAAAAEVLESGAAVTLVPLDATNAAPVTPDFFDRLRDRRTTPSAEFVFKILQQRHKDIVAGNYYFWDSLAAAVAIDESYSPPTEFSIRVEQTPGNEGQTKVDETGRKLRVCRGANLAAFEQLFLGAIAPVGPTPESEG
ncbi:Inosine-uridine preferring nucleoside hydrolase [Fimbriiglobus ruber]|uniref:Inosine-uridine preferring nucleoside hydrolase n=1 Tax=Fimbriiglobus ruber TaxID=1908690 RepID=A0A225CZD8_9BACT|nr:Inosine-uridine preferring nucleoside hydrolase [Fimbriiglobus ruber]